MQQDNQGKRIQKPTAAIFLQDRVFWASYEPTAFEPHSALTQLVQGIYEKYPEQALGILRHRIFVNYEPSILCLGMLAIAAKRVGIDRVVQQKIEDSKIKIEQVDYVPPLLSEEVGMSFNTDVLNWLAEGDQKDDSTKHHCKLSPPLYLRNRTVRAVLVDSTRKVVARAENKNYRNKTHHAEVLLLQHYFHQHQQSLPSPIILVTSLQCCKMCAAMVWHMCADPLRNLTSVYLKKENGPSARNTILSTDSPTRRQWVASREDAQRVLEFPFPDWKQPSYFT